MYQIQLEDRENNRKVMIECQEDMSLESLYKELEASFYLSSKGEIVHFFQTNGQVYVPCPDVVRKHWSNSRDNDKVAVANCRYGLKDSREREILSSKDFHLKEVFTVKESAILFQQIHRSYRSRIYCTLIDRVRE